MVVDLLRHPIGKPRLPPHAHPQGEVLPVDEGGHHQVQVGVARMLDERGVAGEPAEVFVDYVDVGLDDVCRDLDVCVRLQARLQVSEELYSGLYVCSPSYGLGSTLLTVSMASHFHRSPAPSIGLVHFATFHFFA